MVKNRTVQGAGRTLSLLIRELTAQNRAIGRHGIPRHDSITGSISDESKPSAASRENERITSSTPAAIHGIQPACRFCAYHNDHALKAELSLLKQSAQINDRSIRTGNIVSHHQRVISQHTKTIPIQDNRAAQGFLGFAQFPDNLS